MEAVDISICRKMGRRNASEVGTVPTLVRKLVSGGDAILHLENCSSFSFENLKGPIGPKSKLPEELLL